MSLMIDDPKDDTDADALASLPNYPSESDLAAPDAPSPHPIDFGRDRFSRGRLSPTASPALSTPSTTPASSGVDLDISNLIDVQEQKPLLYMKPNGHFGLNREPDIEKDFPPQLREMYGDDWVGMIRFMLEDARDQGVERENFILRDMEAARKMGGADLPAFEKDLEILSAQAGMTQEEYRHWQERDPKYIANQITDREILRLSGREGYVTKLARDPSQREISRKDAMFYARAEAHYLAQKGDFFDRAGYDLRSGFGQVAAFGLTGMAAIARAGADIAEWNYNDKKNSPDAFARSEAAGAYRGMKFSADWWNEYVKDKKAEWAGPPIDTGNPTLDFVRTSIFQGAPMLGAFVAASAIPGVGTAGSSAIMGSLMAGDTYNSLRNDGISPLIAASASVPVGLVSYATNKFTLDNLTRYLGGRSPMRLFSIGTALEVAEEGGQEVIENTTQAAAEGFARLIGDPEYNSRRFFADMKEGVLSAFTEGGMASISTGALRLLGFPFAVRNQVRANMFAKSFSQSGEAVAKTEIFARAPDMLAASMNNMAGHYNGGPVFTSVEELTQAGVTREQAIAPIKDGGLGLTKERYDAADASGDKIAVGYGDALVFKEKQKAAGNAKAEEAFSVHPDAMSVGDIRAQRLEAEAIIIDAETYFQQLQQNNEEGTPLRLRVFRAGLRAAGYNAMESDATTAMYRAGAKRHAEQWETTLEAWLDLRNVQLMMEQTILSSGRREAQYYSKLLKELNEQSAEMAKTETTTTEKGAASGSKKQAKQAYDVFGDDADNNLSADGTEPVTDGATQQTTAQKDAGIQLEPATTAEERTEWEAAVVDTASTELANALGVPEEGRKQLAETVRQTVEAARPVLDSVLSQGDAATELAAPPSSGRQTEIIFPAETGKPPLPAHYELVEADSLQPSHTPGSFAPNPAWPAEFIAQQRNYDSPSMEATRQGIKLSRLDFGALFNPTTDAVNGPPIIMPDGMVLGGNNRTLRILNRYEQDNYKMMLAAHLTSRGNATGIEAAAAEAMNKPVLVRVAENATVADAPALIGALNADFTTRRDAGNLAANRGMRVGSRTLRAFAGIGDQTISSFLDNPEKAFGVVQAMLAEGVFQETDLPTIFNMMNGKWLSGGKAQVEQALFGAVLPDSRLLDEMTPAIQRKLLKALPALVRLKTAGSAELADLFQAISWHNKYQEFRETALGKQFKTEAARLEAFRRPDMANMFTGEMEAEKGGAAWDMLLEIQKAKSQKDVAEFFARKADEISGVGRGLFSLQQGAVDENGAEYFDIRGKAAPLVTVEETAWTGTTAAMRQRARASLFAMRDKPHVNSDTGWQITIGRDAIDKTLNESGRSEHFQALEKLPELLANAVLVRRRTDTKARSNINAFYRLYAPVEVGGNIFAAQITIKENIDGRKGFYVQRLQIKEPAVTRGVGDAQAQAATLQRSGSQVNISKLLHDVKSEDAQSDISLNGDSAIETLYQPAYHGSPHRFDKFSLDAIGTGEGNQAYGWGLYFAGDKGVSEAYRENLTRKGVNKGQFKGREVYLPSDGDWRYVDNKEYVVDDDIIAVRALNIRMDRTKEEALKFMRGEAKAYFLSETEYGSVLYYIENDIVSTPNPNGQLYKVEIPDEDTLLNWDTPLPDEQKTKIAEQAAKEGFDDRGIAYRNEDTGKLTLNASNEAIGRFFYKRELSRVLGSEKAASEFLNRAGIKGIRYLDGNSRKNGEGSYNYVIFDDAAISILETYYQDKDALSSPRGSISFPSSEGDPTIIKLFKGADISTVVHELNHLFLNDLINMVKAGKGGDAARRHLDILNTFTDGKLLSGNRDERRDAFEKIASAWERYAMEGVAPSNTLEDPFATFRKYITLAYRGALESLEEPSPEVRRVFDAFLATDEEIAAAAKRRELRDDWSKLGNSSENVRRKMDDINARRDARERKRKDASKKGGGGKMRRESALDALRRYIKGKLSEERVYRAIDVAKALGGMNRASAIAAIGEAAVKKIEEIHGDGIFAKEDADGVSMIEIATTSGYSADAVIDMLSDMADAESVDARAEREARERQEEEDVLDDIAGDEQEEAEGVDDGPTQESNGSDKKDHNANTEQENPDSSTTGDMTEEEELQGDTADMFEEVEAAIEDEVTDGGADESLERKRELQRRLQEWRDLQAILRRETESEVFSKTMRTAADIRAFRANWNQAKRNAYAAMGRGNRAAVTRWKKQQMYHHYQIVAARKARALRDGRILKQYSNGALRTAINAVAPETKKLRDIIDKNYNPDALRVAINAAQYDGRMEYEYAKSLAQVAIWAGMADSRFLRQMAGDSPANTLVLPQESSDLGGLVKNIEDTLDDWLLNLERPKQFKDFRDFTVEQLFEIDRLMRWLIDNGKGKLNALKDREAANLEDLVGKSTAPMARRKDLESTGGRAARTAWNKILNGLNRFLISLTIPENWFMAMDGNPTIQGRDMGINQRLFRAMVDADVKKGILYASMMEQLGPHFAELNKERERWEKTVGGRFAAISGLPMPEIMKRGRGVSTWDFDLLLSIALNMGNDANLRRLLTDAEFDARFGTKIVSDNGQDMSVPRYNLTNAQLAIVAEQFSAAGWKAIQGLLDGINSLYGDADAVTFNLTNRHVPKEQPMPHTVRTADGEVLSLAGGYFPLVNDPMLSARAAEMKEQTNIEEQIRTGLLNNIHGSAKREVGALKSRARSEQGVPMVTLPQILNTSIVIQHIDTMAHYITHAAILRDLDRMTRHKDWRDAYVAKFGQEQYKAIRRWLKNLAAPERGSGSPGEMFMERMRGLATVNALGLRWKTGLKQRLGAAQAANFMTDASMTKSSGWKWVAVGISELGFTGNLGFGNDKVKFVQEKSDFMRARSGGFDREVRALREKMSPLHREYFGKSVGEWQNLAFAWIQANDQAMASAVWLGAYRQALAGEANVDIKQLHEEGVKAGKDEAAINAEIEQKAIEYADMAAATQASSFAADLTEIQRDRGFMRFISMFMSGNVRQGSRLMQFIDAYRMGDKTGGDVAMLAVREFVFPSLAWVFATAAVKYAAAAALGIGDDDDDHLADFLKDAFWETAGTATAPFPILRDVPSAVQYGFMSGDVPAVRGPARAISNIAGVPGRLADAQYMRAVGQVMDAAGFAFGFPIMNPLNDLGISELTGLKEKRK